MNLVTIVFLTSTIVLEVQTRKPSEAKDTSVPPSFQRELRWLIQRVHSIKRTPHTESSPSGVIQLLKARNAFATAKRNVRKNVAKRSTGKDFLEKVTSLIKEKEDESVKSSVCSPTVDLAFVIDGCGTEPFHVCTTFVKDFIKISSAVKNKIRVGVIMYSRKAKLLFGFNYFKNAEDSFDTLDRIRFTSKQYGKAENIGVAMTKARDMLFTASRMGVPKVLVVITGARANDDIINPSQLLHKDGIVIYAAGFGNNYDRSQLEMIATEPVHDHVLVADSHQQSSGITAVLRSDVCKGQSVAVKEDSIQRYQGPAKVVFLLDGSGNIGLKEIKNYKLFIKDVYENLSIPPGGVTFGLVECGRRHYTQRYVLTRTFQSSSTLDITLDKLVPTNGTCELGQSLKMINKNVFKKLPNGAPKALVVVLAGKSVDDATNVAEELSDKGVRIVALGAGGQADMRQLVGIADSPLYAFKVPKFQYLPSMTSTVVGFINDVTEPKYFNSKVVASDLSEGVNEEKQSAFQEEQENTDSTDINQSPNGSNDLMQSLPPILDELAGHEPDSWLSALESDIGDQGNSMPDQNIRPSPNPLSTEVYHDDARPTEGIVNSSNDEGTSSSSGEVSSASQTTVNNGATLPATATNPSQVGANQGEAVQEAVSQPVGGVANPNGEGSSGNSNAEAGTTGGPTNPSQSVAPSNTGQPGGSLNQGQPEASPNSGQSAAPSNLGQSGGPSNQGQPGESTNSGQPAGSSNQGQPGASPNSGQSGAPSNPGQPGGSTNSGQQAGPTIQGQPGSSTNPGQSGAPSSPEQPGGFTNSGQPAGSTIQGQPGASTNPGQQAAPSNTGQTAGPVQVVQAIPISILPVQAIPIQTLTALQPSTGQNQQPQASAGPNQQPPVTTQPQNPQGNNNEIDSKPPKSSKEGNGPSPSTPNSNPAPAVPNSSPAPTVGNQNGESGEGKQSPSAGPDNITPTSSAKLPNPLPSPGPGDPDKGKPKNGKNGPSTQPPGAESPIKPAPTTAPGVSSNEESASGEPIVSNNKPTFDPAKAAGPIPAGNTKPQKPKGAATKPTTKPKEPVAKPSQQPPIVLCQIICGSDCCTITPKPTPKPTTPTTKPTSKATTLPKTTAPKPTTEAVAEVMGAAPVPLPYPQHPVPFPHVQPLPFPPQSLHVPPLPYSSDSIHVPHSSLSGHADVSSSSPIPAYMTLPPATPSPPGIILNQGSQHPDLNGHCVDMHPDCESFVMSGLCHQPSPYKEMFNVLEFCMLSCGACDNFIKHDQDATPNVRHEFQKPEDFGFPEYSKNFLKRQVRGSQATEEIRRKLVSE